MSIINEALKKAEKEKPDSQPAGAAPEAVRGAGAVFPARHFSRLVTFMIIISSLLFASSILIILAKKRIAQAKVAVPKVAPLRAPAQEQAVTIPATTEQQDSAQPAAPQQVEATPEAISKPAVTQNAQEAVSVRDEELPRPRLNGTILGKGEPLAMIGNIIVKRGEYIDGAEVVDIASDWVELNYKGRRYKIRTQ